MFVYIEGLYVLICVCVCVGGVVCSISALKGSGQVPMNAVFAV